MSYIVLLIGLGLGVLWIIALGTAGVAASWFTWLVFIAACMLLGLFLAEVRLARLHAERGTQIAQSYLRLIDPLLDKSAVKVAAREP